MHNLSHLVKAVEKAKKQVRVGGVYAHYRHPDRFYKVLAIALQEKNEEPCVVYQALYGDGLIWVRDLSIWCSYVNPSTPRFYMPN